MIEKPLSNDLVGLDRLRTAVERNQVSVLTAFQFRFHPGLQRIKGLLEDNVIGREVSVHAHWGEYLPDWHPWENYRVSYSARTDLGGGVLLTLCHPIDYLRWLLGEIRTVASMHTSGGGLGIQVEDTAEILLEFEKGMTGNVHLDFLERPPDHHLRITGKQGKILWDNQSGQVDLFATGTVQRQSFPLPEKFERNDIFLKEMQHFIDLVNGKTRSICDLDDGIRSLKVTLGAIESSNLKKFITLT
jgi:predicted dehydrogenase